VVNPADEEIETVRKSHPRYRMGVNMEKKKDSKKLSKPRTNRITQMK